MNDNNLWEEKNLIEHQKNYENKNVSETNDTMNETKTNSTPNDWRDITDPKLRKKMRLREKSKRYRKKHIDKVKARNKEFYYKHRKLKKPIVDKESRKLLSKISDRLRQRLCKAIDRNSKNGSAVKDLGCTITEFKSYLESKFQTGMSWDNYGLYGWHIDHIKPLSSFDLNDHKQVLEACHYTNLQPLWAKDNLSKHAKT